MKIYKLIIVTILLQFALGGCTFLDPASRKEPEDLLPASYSQNRTRHANADQWWREFNSPELNQLVNEALGSNLNLQQAWARLMQARASAVIAGADQFPDLNLSSDVSHAQKRENTALGYRTNTIKERSLGLASQYEIDLWGRIRAGQKSALFNKEATEKDLEAAAMSISAEVARNWIQIIYALNRKKILNNQIKTNEKYLELTRLRFVSGMNTALDILQQKENLAGTRALLPLTDSNRKKHARNLALLLARPANKLPQCERTTLPEPGPVPDTGIPAHILQLRPDIRAAWKRLRQADWEVTAAKANLLPRITLTARHEYSSDQYNTLFNNWINSLAAGLTAPLFDGKRRVAEVERTKAVVQEKLSVYKETVLTAVKEVEDAMDDEYWQRQYIKKLQKKMDASESALKQARFQYLKGMSTYLPVLNELLSSQAIKLDLLTARKDLLLSRIALYRALGGTWTDNLEEKGLSRPAKDGK